MGEIIEQAQKRLEKKREELKATGNLTHMTQSFEKCIHGVPVRIECPVCKRSKEIESLPTDHPKCEHGNPTGYCFECNSIEEHKRREEIRIKEEELRLRDLKEYPEGTLKICRVPKKYIECSLETYRGNDQLLGECRKYNGGGLVLSGNTGTGKTHLAVALLRELIKADKLKGDGDFITVPDLLLEIRSSFKDKAEVTEETIINHFSKVPVLILDDLGSEKTTEFAVTTLYIIIDRRDREMLTTIITTNLTLKEIEEKLDARIASRLAGMKTIKINMSDYRKLKH